MDPKRVALYRKHMRAVVVRQEVRCKRCSMWVSPTSGLHGQLGDLCSTTERKGRVRYVAGVSVPGMILDPRDFPELAPVVKAALVQARAEKRGVTVKL